MEEAPENGKESSHSAHANGMNEEGFLHVNINQLTQPLHIEIKTTTCFI
jgi:hypothetical protein